MTKHGAEPLRFSVIIVSRHRLKWLHRCLLGVSQLDYPAFEVIVVADPESARQIKDKSLKIKEFDEQNISKARNIGIALAGGDVCAFIDDDAVPEPLWLHHLNQAFTRTLAQAAVGYVRGRNGFDFQSKIDSIAHNAETHHEPETSSEAHIPKLQPDRAVKLIGTNMAIRRDALLEVGGFDPGFRFFLEDSDLSLRLSKKGKQIAAVPDAQVHHENAPSDRRTSRRAPRNLFDIGRSSSLFLRRHYGGSLKEAWRRIESVEKQRLERHLVAGTCEPHDLKLRLNELADGWRDGETETLQNPEIESAMTAFLPYPARSTGHVVFSSLMLKNRNKIKALAHKEVHAGKRMSLFSFSLTPFRHNLRFTDCGLWLQTGGLFGRSDRKGPIFRWCRFADRTFDEIHRVANFRGIGQNLERKRWDFARGDTGDFYSEDTQ